jgi:putative hydrolase of the HAD superfamily
MTPIPDGVRAVFFDAVGTLIHPEPSAAESYHRAGSRHGSRLDPKEVHRRFATAFRAEETLAGHAHRTDEAREVQRWRRIVSAVLDDVSDLDDCFRDLYEHFARADAWRCEPGAGEVLAKLRESGLVVGVASNFDHRLRGVLAGLTELGRLDHLAISSEVGWKKPAPQFFATLCSRTNLKPHQILVVGDDFDNDIQGARDSGMHALLVLPRDRRCSEDRAPALTELFGFTGRREDGRVP